jgi:hypothetical protein
VGSFVELNDTLQITKEQGFPKELDLEKHLQTPFTAEQFKDKIFTFHDKPAVRLYHLPPIRNFLAENRDGKWIYWGLVHIIETTCDYVKKTTSGKFTIQYLYTPEEMKKAHDIMDRREETKFFE